MNTKTINVISVIVSIPLTQKFKSWRKEKKRMILHHINKWNINSQKDETCYEISRFKYIYIKSSHTDILICEYMKKKFINIIIPLTIINNKQFTVSMFNLSRCTGQFGKNCISCNKLSISCNLTWVQCVMQLKIHTVRSSDQYMNHGLLWSAFYIILVT